MSAGTAAFRSGNPAKGRIFTSATRRIRLSIAGILLASGLGLTGCSAPPDDAAEDRRLAAEINAALVAIRQGVQGLQRAAERQFGAAALSPGPERTYQRFADTLFYHQQGLEECAFMATGTAVLEGKRRERLRRLERLDADLREAAKSSVFLSMAWIGTEDSLGAFYPPFDLVAFTPPDLDVPKDIIPYVAANAINNPGRGPVWVEPYVDLTGKGYMTTVSIPVYSDDRLQAVAGGDVSLLPIHQHFLQGRDSLLLLMTGSGFVAGVTPSAAAALGIEALGRRYYLEQVIQDVPAPDRFRLTLHPSPEIRELAEKVVRGDRRFPVTVDGSGYSVTVEPVEESGWHLVRLRRP